VICSDYNIAYSRRRFLKPCLTDREIREMEILERLCFSPAECYDIRTLRLFVSMNGIGILRYYDDTEESPRLVAFHLFDCINGELITLDVHPNFRGRGIATQLLQLSLKKLRDLGHTRTTCEIAVDNEPSLRLHRKFGFVPVRLLRHYYGPGKHAYYLTARLK
jgi:ribosomal protein S18 acetylase RimI-like enzyme